LYPPFKVSGTVGGNNIGMLVPIDIAACDTFITAYLDGLYARSPAPVRLLVEDHDSLEVPLSSCYKIVFRVAVDVTDCNCPDIAGHRRSGTQTPFALPVSGPHSHAAGVKRACNDVRKAIPVQVVDGNTSIVAGINGTGLYGPEKIGD
jgi:hypothetical protein